MIDKVTFILSELHNKLCKCVDGEGKKVLLLNPAFHSPTCIYKMTVENEKDIEWTKKEPTQES